MDEEIAQKVNHMTKIIMDEEIAEKVNHMTKIIMAATADAWLIHLPGMARRHEVFTAESGNGQVQRGGFSCNDARLNRRQ
jgi:hypothetical protein